MIKSIRDILVLLPLLAVTLSACNDDDTFSASTFNRLTLGVDTVYMDTVFSRVPASMRTFWIYNNSGDGIRCTNVRLQNGNQTGFRVNVDGINLGEQMGYQTSDIEIRKGDSIRVFVELTSRNTYQLEPKEIEDNLVFTLESGVRQTVNLNAWSWDADMVQEMNITQDSVIDNAGKRPLIIYKGITIDSLATLTIAKGSTIYFHDDAGIEVKGRLVCQGDSTANVVLRGDRLDNMFDYLPYDLVSGRWKGIHFASSSYGNIIDFTDIHSGYDGIVCDSSDVMRQKLVLSSSIIHNCKGYGLSTCNAKVDVTNCQITNTLGDCVAVFGGDVSLLHCTLAQFYPFDAQRGAALRFCNNTASGVWPLVNLSVRNSIVTGYADDEVRWSLPDSTAAFNYSFAYSLLRTPQESDTISFGSIVWEDVKDTLVAGKKNFKRIDTDLLRYDFHLDSISKACGTANKAWALPYNRDGIKPENRVNMGCY